MWIKTENRNTNDSASSRGGGGTPYNGLYGETPPEKSTLFRLQVYERVEILQVEVYERIGKSVISICKVQMVNRSWHFMAVKKTRKGCDLVCIHNLKIKYLQQLKGIQSSKVGIWKWYCITLC